MLFFAGNVIATYLLATIVLAIVFTKNEKKQIGKMRLAIFAGMLFVMAVIFTLTGINSPNGFHKEIYWESISYIPFRGICSMLRNGLNMYAFENIFGNILMFVPIGFFVPLLWRKRAKFWKVILIGFGISFLIEFSQLFLIRGTDVDDLILNTFGAAVGYLFHLLTRFVFRKRMENIQKRYESKKWNGMLTFMIFVPYFVAVIIGFVQRCFYFYS